MALALAALAWVTFRLRPLAFELDAAVSLAREQSAAPHSAAAELAALGKIEVGLQGRWYTQNEERAAAMATLLSNRDAAGEDTSPEARAKFVDDFARMTRRPPVVIRALLPDTEVSEPESSTRFILSRDLLQVAAAAGDFVPENIVYISADDPSLAGRFGSRIKTRGIRLEYQTTFAAHQEFVSSLIRRRERGPFYSIDSVEIEPAGPLPSLEGPAMEGASKPGAPAGQVRVLLQIRRLMAMTGVSK